MPLLASEHYYSSWIIRKTVNLKHKITILVAAQITLIVASFLILAYLESQTNLTGNAVNTAGINRLLTSTVQMEVNRWLIHNTTQNNEVFYALEDLEDNIYLLKSGGERDDIMIPPLPPELNDDWNEILVEFEQYSAAIIALQSKENLTLQDIDAIDQISASLIILFDSLTGKLGHGVENFSNQMVFLQITLGIINVAAHIFMIFLILRIFSTHAAEQIKIEKFATIGKFASTIAHDMRNPLGTIRNSITLIQNKQTSKTISQEADRINRSIKRMSHQIEGVLNYARAVPLVLKSASVQKILKQSIDSVAIPENIKLDLPENDITIRCDTEKLEFVFANLILNALQAIGNSFGYIKIRLKDEDGIIELEFENSGAQIPKKSISRVFEPLFTTKMQGTGLGLTSCQNIIERHRGTITCRNDPVTFTIRLPKDG